MKKTFRFYGLSAGTMDIDAETKEDALAQAQDAEWHMACSCGNHPDLSYGGQICWEVVSSQNGDRMFGDYDSALNWYNEICPHDNCGLSKILIKDETAVDWSTI